MTVRGSPMFVPVLSISTNKATLQLLLLYGSSMVQTHIIPIPCTLRRATLLCRCNPQVSRLLVVWLTLSAAFNDAWSVISGDPHYSDSNRLYYIVDWPAPAYSRGQSVTSKQAGRLAGGSRASWLLEVRPMTATEMPSRVAILIQRLTDADRSASRLHCVAVLTRSSTRLDWAAMRVTVWTRLGSLTPTIIL